MIEAPPGELAQLHQLHRAAAGASGRQRRVAEVLREELREFRSPHPHLPDAGRRRGEAAASRLESAGRRLIPPEGAGSGAAQGKAGVHRLFGAQPPKEAPAAEQPGADDDRHDFRRRSDGRAPLPLAQPPRNREPGSRPPF